MFGEGRACLRTMRRAAEQNDAAAQTNLGVLCEFGHRVVRDYAESVELVSQAADHGDAEASKMTINQFLNR